MRQHTPQPPRGRVAPNSDAFIYVTCRSALLLPSKSPFWVRTDKGKEFLNKHFQDMVRDEGIQFRVCRNPDVKCAVVERVHRTIRDRLF